MMTTLSFEEIAITFTGAVMCSVARQIADLYRANQGEAAREKYLAHVSAMSVAERRLFDRTIIAFAVNAR